MPASIADAQRSSWHTAARVGLLVLAVVDLATRVDGIVEGDHFFRQALVLANVEKLLANGILTVPESYNADLFLRLYDFPVWQVLVAMLVRITGADPGLCGEWFNVAIFSALFATAWWLTRLLGLSALAGTVGLAVMALAPIGRFWFAAPSIDPLPVLLATLSFAGWLAWRRSVAPRRGLGAAVLWLATGFLATWIKCPVYLPVAATIFWLELRANGWRTFLRGFALGWWLGVAGSLVGFRWVTSVANAGMPGWPDAATELAWYFGSWPERLSLAPIGELLARIAKQIASLPIVGAAVVGAAWCWRGRRWPLGIQELGVGAATAVATSLLFLHVNLVHNYYQLPCLVPVALLAGAAVSALWPWLPASPTRRRWASTLLLVGLAAGAAWSSERYLARSLVARTIALRATGAAIARLTDARDFVLYGTASGDDNPAFLYFAHRDGANVIASADTAVLRQRWQAHADQRGGRLILFVPSALAEVAAARRREPAWRELAAEAAGWLFVVG